MARARANIYEGPNSCYARREGIYVSGNGVNLESAAGIAKLILRDYERRYSYDHSCNPIPFNWDLAVKRLRYLIALARKHYGESEASKVRKLVDFVVKTRILPPEYLKIANKAVVQVRKPVEVPVTVRRRRVPVYY